MVAGANKGVMEEKYACQGGMVLALWQAMGEARRASVVWDELWGPPPPHPTPNHSSLKQLPKSLQGLGSFKVF